MLVSGASSGIGAEFARQFHAQGAGLILVARRAELLAKHCQEFNALRADSAKFLAADLSVDAELARISSFVEQHKIDILVNNAGFGSFNCFEKLDIEREKQMVRLNVLAYMQLTHAVLPQMKARKSGAIINVSSIAGLQPIPFMATYGASKSFELFHSLALSYELRPDHIKVLAVCPGPTATEFFGVARVPGTVTDVKRDSVDMVVRQSLRALDCDNKFIVTGFKSKLLAIGSRLFPLKLTTRITERMLRPILRQQP